MPKMLNLQKEPRYYNLDCQKVDVSIPRATVEKVDLLRGDVTRSRFFARILETTLDVELKRENNSVEASVLPPTPTELPNKTVNLNDGQRK